MRRELINHNKCGVNLSTSYSLIYEVSKGDCFLINLPAREKPLNDVQILFLSPHHKIFLAVKIHSVNIAWEHKVLNLILPLSLLFTLIILALGDRMG